MSSALIVGPYRYTLTREAAGTGGPLLFVMLNPSTADATADDNTIRRCLGFAARENASALAVVNLFALRSRHPDELDRVPDPVGPDNDLYLHSMIFDTAAAGGTVVAAWGAHPAARRRVAAFTAAAAGTPVFCLGVTVAGAPKHPLFLPRTAPLIPWAPPAG